jgi:tRNA nucleotidyltransferase (CCA-adding enzyme)
VQNKVHPLDRFTLVYGNVKKRIVPPKQVERQVRARAEEIRRAVEEECNKARLAAEVRLDGSVAKDTWIRDYVDADIFMRVSPDLTKKQLHDVCLPIARRALRPHKIVERFAEHPYIESVVEFQTGTLRVNVVPCYRVEKGKWLSATDRTPYHTEYVRSRLAEHQRDEVRLLKAFMRGIGAYGADIRTGGFSGMICETLIIAREDFQKVLQEFAGWKEGRFIDVENYYAGRGDEIHRIFIDPLVVIDPVDKGRNLGAAVRSTQLWNFTAASRRFLEKPSPLFFTEPMVRPIAKMEFRRGIAKRGSAILCIKMNRIDAVVDIVWSQLFRTERALVNLLENSDFEVVRSSAWTDESSLSVLLFELASHQLSSSKRHRGPPVSRHVESSSFLSKHLRAGDTVSGPWIEDDRWYVEKKRAVVSAHALLAPILRSGGSDVGVASLVIRTARKSAKILEGNEIEALLSVNREFAKFMRVFLAGRPVWLD